MRTEVVSISLNYLVSYFPVGACFRKIIQEVALTWIPFF